MNYSVQNDQLTPRDMVAGVEHLITLPDVWFRLQSVLKDPNHDWHSVAEVIKYDLSLTAKILKLVNSAYFGLPGKIDRITKAISMIGENELNHLVLGSSVAQAIDSITATFPNLDDFWKHSVRVAVLGRLIAKSKNVLHPERLFIAGLLHDMGKLIIHQQSPEIGYLLYATEEQNPYETLELEHKLLGFGHAEVAAQLAKNWHLPDALSSTLLYHHNPEAANEYIFDANIIHVSNALVGLTDPTIESIDNALATESHISQQAVEFCNISAEKMSELMLETMVESLVVHEAICS